MKLIKARVQNFRSIEDTGEFSIDELTCLVGKNEAGKTAILQAIEAQRPYSTPSTSYDIVKEYPRRFVTQFQSRHPNGYADVCTTTWSLDEDDREALVNEFGEEFLTDGNVIIRSGFGFNGTKWTLPANEKKGIDFLLSKFKLDASERNILNKATTGPELVESLKNLQKTDKQEALYKLVSSFRNHSLLSQARDILDKNIPTFIYVSHYDRMAGQIAVESLIEQKGKGKLSKEDEIFLSLLSLAGTSLNELKDSSRYEELKAKCEAASNAITEQIFKYWTQNEALNVQIELSQGRSEDPAPYNTGTVVRTRVWNDLHKASVPFSERSAGFV